MTFSKNKLINDGSIFVICLILIAIIFIADLYIRRGIAVGVAYTLVVLVSLWSSQKNLPYQVAGLSTALIVTGVFYSPESGDALAVFFNRVLSAIVVWTTAVLSQQRRIYRKESKQALENIKLLQGIIPICTYCHNVSSAEGSWDKLDVYIAENSDAEFSHGVCPHCYEKALAEVLTIPNGANK